jgi:hypothetical protein
MKNKYAKVFIFMMLCFHYGKAQYYPWLNTITDLKSTAENVKICRDDSNNYYVLTNTYSDSISRFFTNGVNSDSGIIINSKSKINGYSFTQSPFIFKYNKDGVFLWAKKCMDSGFFHATDFQYNNQKLYVTGVIGNSDYSMYASINNQTYYATSGLIILASYDKNGTILTSLQFPEITIHTTVNKYKSLIRIVDTNTIYVLYCGDTYHLSPNLYNYPLYTIFFKKIVADKIVSGKEYYNSYPTYSNFSINDFDISNGNIYFIGGFNNYDTIFGQKPVYSANNNLVLFKADTAFNISWIKTYNTSQNMYNSSSQDGSIIKCKGDKIFILFPFTVGNLQIDSFNISLVGTSANKAYALFDTSGNALWLRSGSINNMNISCIDFSNKGICYIYGQYYGTIYFDNLLFNNNGNGYFIGEMNKNGKMKSIIPIVGDVNSSIINDSENIIVSGNYKPFPKKSLGNLMLPSKGQIYSSKIQGTGITIGSVSNHPFCSGDSIFIPYSIIGKFNAGNHFTAQLSNSSGSFDSVFYKLAFVTDTLGGIIKGKIPDTLFTSTKYSIRIVADSPMVISYEDTINYFITQKPTAHEGSDALICFGQSIHIGDSNSSALYYHWKPFLFMNDSTAKFPFVKPDTSIKYFLIAQSNNCFAYDTVLINVRKPLSFVSFHDTIFCKNDTLQLQPKVFGGDSIHRIVNVFKLPDTLSFATNDSLMRIRFVPDSSHIYRVVLSDGCSLSFSDTFNLKLRVVLNLKISNDTLVCRGMPLQLSANGWQSDSAAYRFNWSYKNSPITVSSFFNLISDSSMKFLLKSNYVCENKIDSHFVNVKVLPRLQLKLTNDTTMCYGQSYFVVATANGGDTLHYKFRWEKLNDNTTFVDSNYSKTFSVSHLFKPLQTITYHLKLSDGCTFPIDSSQIIISVYPKPQAGFIVDDSVQCFIGNNFLFTDTSKVTYQGYWRYWDLGDATTNIYYSFNKSFNTSGNYQIQLKVVDSKNCSDSVSHSIIVKQNPVNPKILSLTNTQIKSTFSANTYQWFLNNNLIANTNSQTIYIHQNGKYFVKVDSTNGCSNSSDPLNVTVFYNDHILIYPNPNNGNFTINFIELSGIKNIDIYDMEGKLLNSFSTSDDMINIDFQQLFSSGMYLLKIQTDQGTFNEKVVVE